MTTLTLAVLLVMPLGLMGVIIGMVLRKKNKAIGNSLMLFAVLAMLIGFGILVLALVRTS